MTYENNILSHSHTAVSNETIQQIQESVKRALEEVMGDASPEVLDEMASIFLEDAIPLIAQIKDGCAAHDYATAAMAAHTLKGSGATIGLERFARVCLAVETSSKQQAADALARLLPTLEEEYANIQLALRDFLL